MVLIAEAGLGKTRLAQEFFARLSHLENPEGSSAYWPDDLGRDGNNLRVNPPPATWNAQSELPFLWWGLRLIDPFAPNGLAAGVLGAHVEEYLVPHLEPMFRAQRRRHRLFELGKIGSSLATELAGDLVPFLGLAKTVGEAGMGLKELHSGWRQDQSPLDARELAAKRRASLIDRVIGDLTVLFSGRAEARVPGVILIDDGQFSTHDPGLVAFVESLLETATNKSWPLLLIVTHWEREWAVQAGEAAPTVARVLSEFDARHRGAVECLKLERIDDLEPMLRATLPGLLPEQARQLLARTDGNPRFLDEIMRLATTVEGRALFVGRDVTGPLTDAGLAELLSKSVDLKVLIARRLAESPESVQKAVALASAQGTEFLRRLVGETAAELSASADTIRSALAEAATPHAYVTEVSEDVAAFTQRVYFEVARALLPALFDRADVERAMAEVVRRIADDPERFSNLSGSDLDHYLALTAGLFEGSMNEEDLQIGGAALWHLMNAADDRGDTFGAHSLARRLSKAVDRLSDDWLRAHFDWLTLLNRVYIDASDRDARRPLLLRMLQLTDLANDPEPTPDSKRRRARMLVRAGDFYREEGNAENASDAYSEALRMLLDLVEPGFVDEVLMITSDRAGEVLFERGKLDEANRCWETTLQQAEWLHEGDPGPGRLVAVSEAEERLGFVAMARGDIALQQKHCRSALAHAREAHTLGPSMDTEEHLAKALARAAEAETSCDEFDLASELIAECTSIRRRHREVADTAARSLSLAAALRVQSRLAQRMNDFETAATSAKEALLLLRDAAGIKGLLINAEFVACLSEVAQIEVERGNIAEARPHAEEALSIARDYDKSSDDLYSRHSLLVAIAAALPHIHLNQGVEAARALLQEADETYARIAGPARAASLADMGWIEEMRADPRTRGRCKGGRVRQEPSCGPRRVRERSQSPLRGLSGNGEDWICKKR